MFAEIRQKNLALQDQEDEADDMGVDHVSNIPVDMVAHFTGFRYDDVQPDAVRDTFTALKQVN